MSRHHKRLSNARWERTRQAVFRRDNYRCTKCGQPAGRAECHHTVEINLDDSNPYDLATLTTLCPSCHIFLHRKPLSPERAAWRVLLAEIADS